MKIEKDPPTTEKGTGEDHPKGDAVDLGVGGVDLEVGEDLPQNTGGLEHQGLTFIVSNYASLC